MTDFAISANSGQPYTIIGISFDDGYRAQEFLTAVKGMQASRLLRLRDAVIVAKNDDGTTSVRETVDLEPGRAALSGAAWTGLLAAVAGGPVGWIAGAAIGAGGGAVTAKAVDMGVPDEWVEWFRAAVEPDTSTVVVLATDVDFEALVAESMRFDGAHLVYANLAPGIVKRLEHALGDEEHAMPIEGAWPNRTDG